LANVLMLANILLSLSLVLIPGVADSSNS